MDWRNLQSPINAQKSIITFEPKESPKSQSKEKAKPLQRIKRNKSIQIRINKDVEMQGMVKQ